MKNELLVPIKLEVLRNPNSTEFRKLIYKYTIDNRAETIVVSENIAKVLRQENVIFTDIIEDEPKKHKTKKRKTK